MTDARTQHTQSLVEVPTSWGEKYTEEDKEKATRIVNWLRDGQEHEPGFEHQRSQTKLSKAANIKATTLNTVIAGKYPSSPTKWLDTALDTIRMQMQRETQYRTTTPFVETSVYRTVLAACKRAHTYRNFAVVAAYVGTGKTTAVKQYAETHSNVFLIEATPDMNAGVLVNELVELLKADVHKANKYSEGTKAEKMRGIINRLKGTDSLIILDEAETVSTQTLEYIRRISDNAGIGVVLSGTEKLKPMIRDPRGRFGQISSRVSFWPKVITSITEKDVEMISHSAMQYDGVALTPEVLDAFWQMCEGSARVLANNLIPGVRDYGLRKGLELTPELIFKVGQELLGFKRRA